MPAGATFATSKATTLGRKDGVSDGTLQDPDCEPKNRPFIALTKIIILLDFFSARRKNCRMSETSLSRHAMRVTSEHNFRLDERTLLLCTKKERE